MADKKPLGDEVEVEGWVSGHVRESASGLTSKDALEAQDDQQARLLKEAAAARVEKRTRES